MSEARKLRVLSIAHSAVLREGGRLRYHPLAERDDLEVHLLTARRWTQFGRVLEADPGDDPGVQMHIQPIWFPSAPLASWYLHIYPGLGRLIRQIRPDVIHLWEEPWSFVALQARLLGRDAKFMLEVDQNILKKLIFPFEQIRRFVLRRSDHILARSPEAEAVVRACGYKGPSSFIAYGVDEHTFYPRSQAEQASATRNGLRLGYVGRVVIEKGLDDVLDALAQCPPEVTLAIMGEGPHQAALEARVETLKLGERVSFQGWGNASQVGDFIRSLDVLALVTRTTRHVREQFGRVIIEAQACGVPVIGSECGAIPHVVGEGGWIVPESDPAALAACILGILAAPAERARRGQAGLDNVASRYTYQQLADHLARCWIEVAGVQRSD